MKHILIVDHGPRFAQNARQLLDATPSGVISANSGKEGLGNAKREKSDLISLDVMMKGRSAGLDLASVLQKDEETKHIPRILLPAASIESPLEALSSPGTPAQRQHCRNPSRPKISSTR